MDIRPPLAFDGEAIVTSMRVEEGAQVKAGQVLATLDSSRKRAELDEAKALVDAQEAVVRRLESGTREQEIEQARAHVASLEAKLANAEQRLQRYQRLTPTGLSQEELDDAQMQVRVERAGLDEAKQDWPWRWKVRAEDIDGLAPRLGQPCPRPAAGTLARGHRAAPRRLARFAAACWNQATTPRPSSYTLAAHRSEMDSRVCAGRAGTGRRDRVPRSPRTRSRSSARSWVGFISPMSSSRRNPWNDGLHPARLRGSHLRRRSIRPVALGMPATVVVDEASPPAAARCPPRVRGWSIRSAEGRA